MSKIKTQLVIEGRNNSRRAFKQVGDDLEGINKKLGRAGKALAATFSTALIVGAVRSISNAADSYNLMNARLKLVTDSQEEFNTAQTELKRVANEVEAPIESLITLYSRIARPMKEAGRSQQDIIDITEAVSRSFRISGASAQEAENGVIQFAQALGAGALRGDEFNSVAEQAPRLMQALAAGLDVPIGSLREMAKQGQLTADVVANALIGQLDELRTESAELPRTVGGAMTALKNEWNEAIGQTDVLPLIESIAGLTQAVSDPALRENLIMLTNLLINAASATVGTATEFLDLTNRVFEMAQSAAGLSTELEDVEGRLKDIDRAMNGTWLSRTADSFIYSKEELAAEKEALEARRKVLVETLTGTNEEVEALGREAAETESERRQEDIKGFNEYVTGLKTIRENQLKSVEDAVKKQVKAEQDALKDIEKIREKRIEIENRYKEALAGLSGDGEPTYGKAQDLKIAARQALAADDVAGAQANAQAALEVLQDLAAAGENTLGFAGFIKELQAIELAANDIENTQAQEKLKSIRTNMKELADEAKTLEDMEVSFKLDDAALAKVREQIMKLAQELGQELVLPVRVSNPNTVVSADIPGFATGTNSAPSGLAWVGEMGPELINLSGGERIYDAQESARIASSLVSEGSGGGTPLNLTIDGKSYSLSGSSDTISELARAIQIQKLKRR